MAFKKFEVLTVFKAVNKITAPMTRMRNSVTKFTRNSTLHLRKLNRSASKVSRALTTGLKRAFTAAAAAAAVLSGAMYKIIAVGSEFDKTITSAALRFPDKIRRGTEEFERLRQAAKTIGETTEFTASQAAKALEFLALSGMNSEDSIAALPRIVDFATAANLDLATASDIATDALGALGMKSEELARLTDVLRRAQSSANATVEQYFETIKKAGPVATTVGMDIETLAAAAGVLANAGIKAEDSGTAIRNMLLRLSAPVGAARALVKKYVGDIRRADGSMVDFSEVVDRFNKSMAELGGVKRVEILDKIFGKRGAANADILIKAGAKSIESYAQTYRKGAGTTADMATEMRNTVSGSIDALKSSVEGVMISLYELGDGAIKNAIDKTVAWIRVNKDAGLKKLGDSIQWVIDHVDDLIKWFKRAAVIVGVIYAITTAIKVATAAMAVFNFVMSLSPMGMIIAAIGAAAALIILNWDDVVLFFKDLWDGIKYVFNQAIDWIVNTKIAQVFFAAVGLIRDNWDELVGFFSMLWSGIKNIFKSAIDAIVTTGPIVILIDIVKTLMREWGGVESFWGGVWDSMTATVKKAGEGIVKFLKPAINIIAKFTNWKNKLVSTGMDSTGVDADRLDTNNVRGGVSTFGRRFTKALSDSSITRDARVVIEDKSGKARISEDTTPWEGLQFERTGSF